MPIGDDGRSQLALLLDAWTPADAALPAFLAERSNLPGPRGNLELADAFAAAVEVRARADAERMWQLAVALSSVTAADAPVNDPREFVAFCGVRAVAAVAAGEASRVPEALARLRLAAVDERWRLREAVAMALQRLLAASEAETLAALRRWVEEGGCLEWRAVAAGLADPPLLKGERLAAVALALHEEILTRLLAVPDRRAADFRTLRQGLGFTLSVVVVATPAAGFALMRRLAMSPDADVRWIVAENLKKNRLAKPFAAETAAVKAVLAG